MKKTWVKPKLTIEGNVAELTQQHATKTIGGDDGYVLIIPGLTPAGGVPIGNYSG